jgi:hypothetical protein
VTDATNVYQIELLKRRRPPAGEQLARLLGIAATRPLTGEELVQGLVLIAQVRAEVAA